MDTLNGPLCFWTVDWLMTHGWTSSHQQCTLFYSNLYSSSTINTDCILWHLFVCRVSAFECLLPDESNPYLQKSPGYSRADGMCWVPPFPRPLHRRTPLREEVFWAQDINKSYSTSLPLTPCPQDWHTT